MVDIALKLKADVISPQHDLVNRALVKKLHEIPVQVVPWTANNQAAWKKLVDDKVDAIISDDPEELIRFLKDQGLR
jgi:glycerophosphoryl diester phosphodiesterase